MGSHTFTVLLIEDGPDDAVLLARDLGRVAGGAFRLESAETLSKGLERLGHGGVDAVLLDLSLPDSLGLSTLTRTRERHADVPIIVMTGLDEESLARAAVEKGAQEYLVKGRVTPEALTRALLRAVAGKLGAPPARDS
jgi:CheY-like chemotaxis protein